MRLLNVGTRKVELFEGDRVPAYAILSHRWGVEEVTLGDINGGTAVGKMGYFKIEKCCLEAASSDLKYVWIDTCCIDKSNSTELSEAINSMYRWYRHAARCFVYMSDVIDAETVEAVEATLAPATRRGRANAELTLQSLAESVSTQLAATPSRQDMDAQSCLFFPLQPMVLSGLDSARTNCTISYDVLQPKLIGTKEELCQEIAEVTHIPAEALEGFIHADYTVAERLSWAARRQTQRIEDRAYSLLGLLDVNMPMLYGEGYKAFVRLQAEIVKENDDHTVFIWGWEHGEGSGSFARSPFAFARSSAIKLTGLSVTWDQALENRSASSMGFTLSNAGISISLYLVPCQLDVYLAVLDRCYYVSHHGFGGYHDGRVRNHVAIFVRKHHPNGCYKRIVLGKEFWTYFSTTVDTPRITWEGEMRSIMMLKTSIEHEPRRPLAIHVTFPGEQLSEKQKPVPGGSGDFYSEIRLNGREASVFNYGSKDSDWALRPCLQQLGIWGVVAIWDTKTDSWLFIHLGYDFEFNLLLHLEGPRWHSTQGTCWEYFNSEFANHIFDKGKEFSDDVNISTSRRIALSGCKDEKIKIFQKWGYLRCKRRPDGCGVEIHLKM